MPPPLRRRKRVSSSTVPNSPVSAAPMRTAADTPRVLRSSPLKELALTPKSPFRRVNDGRIGKSQKQALLDNLELELNERTRKLRSQVSQQSHALRQRIEIRLNRVPKRFWKMTMAELLAQAEGPEVASALVHVGGVRAFVEDIRRQSLGLAEEGKSERLVGSKKRVAQKTATPSEMPPPPPPPSAINPLVLSSKSTLLHSPSPRPSTSPERQSSPIKPPKASTRTRKAAPTPAPDSRPTSRSTTRSSTETATTQGAAAVRGTKSSQAKAKAAAAAAAAAGANESTTKGLKRGGGSNNTGSNGSLKENRVAGVKKEPSGKAATTGRVLRSRK